MSLLRPVLMLSVPHPTKIYKSLFNFANRHRWCSKQGINNTPTKTVNSWLNINSIRYTLSIHQMYRYRYSLQILIRCSIVFIQIRFIQSVTEWYSLLCWVCTRLAGNCCIGNRNSKLTAQWSDRLIPLSNISISLILPHNDFDIKKIY